MWKRPSDTILNCFSPPVMLATFIIEIALAFYVYYMYRISHFTRLILALLFFLAVFQYSEFMICTGAPNILWTRIGLFAITLLPPLGLHLISVLTGRRAPVEVAYALALVFIVVFLFVPGYVTGGVCGGNYVIIHTHPGWGWLYGLYYSGLLLWGVWEAAFKLKRLKQPPTAPQSGLLVWIIVGYLSFMIPMGVVYLLSNAARDAIPSVMCGFALVLAFILALKIAPAYRLYHKR